MLAQNYTFSGSGLAGTGPLVKLGADLEILVQGSASKRTLLDRFLAGRAVLLDAATLLHDRETAAILCEVLAPCARAALGNTAYANIARLLGDAMALLGRADEARAYYAVAFVAAVVLALASDRVLGERFFLATALWMVPAFAFVMCGVGMLRDANGYRLSGLNVPLMLTLLRIALLPGIGVFLGLHHYALALAVYVVASLSDVLDGHLARRWNQTSRLGQVLDPIVDIVFTLAMLSGLTANGLLSRWVFWAGVTRYAVMFVGATGLYLFVGPPRIAPTFFGRMTGVVMSSLIALLTLFYAIHGGVELGLTRLTEIALGVLLGATTIQMIGVGWYNLRMLTGQARATGHVVHDVPRGRRGLGRTMNAPVAALDGDLHHFHVSEVLQLLQLAQCGDAPQHGDPALLRQLAAGIPLGCKDAHD